MTRAEIVKDYLKASKELRKEIGNSPSKARQFLIEAGVLDKSGKKLRKRSV